MSTRLLELGCDKGIAEQADLIHWRYLRRARFIAAGCGWACGLEAKKAGRPSQETSSASMFETPGTCFATKEKLEVHIYKKKTSISSDVLAACPCTLQSLPQKLLPHYHCSNALCNHSNGNPSTNKMGNNSFTATRLQTNLCGTCDAMILGTMLVLTQLHFQRDKERLLQNWNAIHLAKNVCHHSTFLYCTHLNYHSGVSHGFVRAGPISPLRNCYPGRTTLHNWCKCPRDRQACRWQLSLPL